MGVAQNSTARVAHLPVFGPMDPGNPFGVSRPRGWTFGRSLGSDENRAVRSRKGFEVREASEKEQKEPARTRQIRPGEGSGGVGVGVFGERGESLDSERI